MRKSITDRRNTAFLVGAGLLAACLFGAATPASKALLQNVAPQALAGLLYIGAAIGVLPIVLRERSFRLPWRAGRRTTLLLAGSVVCGGVLGPWLLLLGLRVATAGSVSLFLNLELVATVLLGRLIFREHLSTRGWIGAAGTLVAAVLLAAGEGQAGIMAALLVGAGCFFWGFDNHFTSLIDGITPAQTTLCKGVVAGLFNLIMGGGVLGGVGDLTSALLALVVGGLSYGISIALYITAAQGLGASRSQMVFSTAPFFGLVLSLLFLGESFTGVQAGAAVLVASSLALLFSEKHGHIHRHVPMNHQHLHRHDDDHHDHEHADVAISTAHAHSHSHKTVAHEHVHWPDLHHRHNHEEREPDKPSD
ncbi:DMT family transporter [Candidatus Bipolaricaulota bacterium]|nr:DMT family transporter [Candidatus Bipolaricaulota bacterium]